MQLIIGNGLIGRHLSYKLRGDSVLLTRKEIELNSDSWEIPKCSTAYICAGETSTQRCEEWPKETRLVNVTNTIKLAKRLLPAQVIWISSERVFDGSAPFREAGDAVCPASEYGKQKVEAEKELLKLGVTVIRFSKVIGWDVPLFEGWIRDLREGKEIKPFSNMGMSPLSVLFATEVLTQMKGNRLYQVSGDKDISYSQIAYYIANLMGKAGFVHPVEAKKEHPYTTLENNTGFSTPSSWEVIQEWCRNRLLN